MYRQLRDMLPSEKKETNWQGLRPVDVQVLKACRAYLTVLEKVVNRRPVGRNNMRDDRRHC
jgi:hypothetical protein